MLYNITFYGIKNNIYFVNLIQSIQNNYGNREFSKYIIIMIQDLLNID